MRCRPSLFRPLAAGSCHRHACFLSLPAAVAVVVVVVMAWVTSSVAVAAAPAAATARAIPTAAGRRATALAVAGSELEGYFAARGYTTLPLRRDLGNHLEVAARINGHPGRFLLDTGAQISVVHRGSLRRFGLTAVKTSVRVYGAVGGPGEQIQAALAANVQVGPCAASPFLLGVSDLSTLNDGRQRGGAGNFDGIIGADLLQSFDFVIDCGSPQLFVRNVGGTAAAAAHPELGALLRGHDFAEVPMKRVSISDFEVIADINRRRAVMLVDTGAAVTLLDRELSRRAGVEARRTNLTVGGAGGGRQRIAIGIIKNLRMSSFRAPMALFALSDLTAVGAELAENGRPPLDGYLGSDFLRNKRAIIDCARMRLYLRN